MNFINGDISYQKEPAEGDFRMYDINYYCNKLVFSAEKNLYAIEMEGEIVNEDEGGD